MIKVYLFTSTINGRFLTNLLIRHIGYSPGPSCSKLKVDNAIHRINHYPLDIAIGFAITYPVDSDLSGG